MKPYAECRNGNCTFGGRHPSRASVGIYTEPTSPSKTGTNNTMKTEVAREQRAG
jgi:hypothetical protein